MSEHIRKLKENAARLAAKGRLEDAADEYMRAVREDPHDLTARQRMAEVLVRLGHIDRAVKEYQSVAGRYVADGLLLKAIAICKIILQVDPSHTETQHILADLTTRRRGEHGTLQMPEAMSKALAHVTRRQSDGAQPSGSSVAATGSGLPRTGTRPSSSHAGAPSSPAPGPHGGGLPRTSTQKTAQVVGAAAPAGGASSGAPSVGTGPGGGQASSTARAVPSAMSSAVSPEDSGRSARSAAARPPDFALVSARAAAIASVAGDRGAAATAGASGDSSFPEPAIDITLDDGSPVVLEHVGAAQRAGPRILPLRANEGAAEDVGFSIDVDLGLDAPETPAIAPAAAPSESFIEIGEPAPIDLDTIPTVPLFSDLPREAFIALTEQMELRVGATGEVLMEEGEIGNSMFIIIQGRVTVKRPALDGGADVVLAELGESTFFGEMALIADAQRVATVVCAEDTLLFEISRHLLEDIIRQHPSVADVMRRFHKNRLLNNLLATCPIFQAFAWEERKVLIEKFKSTSVDAGVTLLTRAHRGDGLYVILSGRCHVVDPLEDGREIFLAELKEGDVFGETSMLWHKDATASVKTVTPCVVLKMSRPTFNEVIMTHPQILQALSSMSRRRELQNSELLAVDIATDFIV